MADYREFTFGGTLCRIYVRKHVEAQATYFPSVATAFANDAEIIEDGEPVERVGGTDEAALESMCSYLEKRYGAKEKPS